MAQTLSRPQKPTARGKQGTSVLRASKTSRKSKSSKKGFAELTLKVTPILKPYANRISVFGSFARGEATPSSDIDLLIALKPAESRPTLGLIEFIRLEQALANKLGRAVDLVTEDGLNPRRRQNIEKDKVVLYEAK